MKALQVAVALRSAKGGFMNNRLVRIAVVALVICSGVIGSASAAKKLKPGITVGYFTHDFEREVLGIGHSTIQELEGVDAGQYIANAWTSFTSNDPQFHTVECAFVFGTDLPRAGSHGDIGGDTDNHLTLPLSIGFVLNSPKTVSVACRADAPDTVRTFDGHITIIRVDELITDGQAIVVP